MLAFCCAWTTATFLDSFNTVLRTTLAEYAAEETDDDNPDLEAGWEASASSSVRRGHKPRPGLADGPTRAARLTARAPVTPLPLPSALSSLNRGNSQQLNC